MPIYEFVCQNCGGRFEKLCRLEQADAFSCPSCGGSAKRCLSGFAFKSGASFKSSSGNSCASCGGGSCSSCGH